MRTRHLISMLFAAAALLSGALPASGQQAEFALGQSPAEMRRRERLFDEHVVRMGETAFSIARGYAISPVTLAEDNPAVELTRLRAGQVLFVRKRERGRTGPEQVARQWQEMVGAAQTDGATGDGTQGVPQATEQQPGSVRGSLGNRNVASGIFDRRNQGTEPHIALILPLGGTNSNTAGNDFTDLYKGALLALEDLRSQGRSARVTLYDSARNPEKVQGIVSSAEFIDTDLILGPVYEEEMVPAVQFAEFFNVPVVSPLAAIRRLDSETLYQMAPAATAKYDKLRPLFEGNANIILISSGTGDDAEFEREITAELGARSYGRFTIGGEDEIASLIDWERENVLVVLADGEQGVDRALATISSSYNNASAKRSRRANITVVGSSKWAGYGASIDENLFFKLNVRFVTNYYINHSDKKTELFEARYLEAYGDLPSRASFRGYDAVALFAGALFEPGSSPLDRLERVGTTPLGTPYRFVQTGGNARHVNDRWTLVSFSSDYHLTTL